MPNLEAFSICNLARSSAFCKILRDKSSTLTLFNAFLALAKDKKSSSLFASKSSSMYII